MTIEDLFQHFLNHRSVTTDSRNITPGCIFFALKGQHFNGNDFLHRALEQGAGIVVGDEDRGINDHRCWIVNDALSTLQDLAREYRRSWNFPVLAITGSNGKTTTKELIRDVLQAKYKVHATKGNLNNHIGIPLTILSAPENTELAIIEMGANHQKEIGSYCRYAIPTHGLITNIGKAHLEGFGGQEGVMKGKKELFDYLFEHSGKIFANLELPFMKEITKGMPFYSLGQYFQIRVEDQENGMHLTVNSENGQGEFFCHLTGTYNVHNVLAALEIGHFFGVSFDDAVRAIAAYIPENMRSQWKDTGRNKLIIDAYNANPTSLEHALTSLGNRINETRLAIIGEMKEMGEYSASEHQRIVELVTSLSIDAIFVGSEFEPFKKDYTFFQKVEELMMWIEKNPIHGKTILIKGSRGVQLERILPLL